MPKFFRNPTRIGIPSLYTLPHRTFSTRIGEFSLATTPKQTGKIVKILFSGNSNPLSTLSKSLIEPHKNSLFIGTTPTTTSLTSTFGKSVYPGHNFSFITDENGAIACSMSKRPDTNRVVSKQKRIPDPRFKDLPLDLRVFLPQFTSVEEDLKKWFERAKSLPHYPLFFHIIPLVPGLSINAKTYRENVEYLLAEKANYTLHSTLHPLYDRYIPASNCNSATEQAIFGPHTRSVQDMFCQEAVMEMVSKLVEDKEKYLQTSDSLGLTQGIEKSEITEENYRALFTA
ncbi:TPA: hypothetical protein ACPSKE_001021 [Legionella feeleii]